MSERPAGWWSWHAMGAALGIGSAWMLARDPFVVALAAAAALGWSAGRHRLAPWLGALMNVLYGVLLGAAWLALHHHGGRR